MVEATKRSQSATILLMVGLPASGKSSLATHLQRRLQSEKAEFSAIKVISFDSIQLELLQKQSEASSDAVSSPEDLIVQTGALDKESQVQIWHDARQIACDRAKQELQGQASGSLLIVLDDVFEYKSMRKPFYQMAADLNSSDPSRSVSYFELHVCCSVERAIKNNEQRQKQTHEASLVAVTPETIKNIHSRLEPSAHSDIHHLTLNDFDATQFHSNSSLRDQVLHTVYKSITQAQQPVLRQEGFGAKVDEQTKIDCNNLVHQTDLCLRKQTGLLLQQHTALRQQSKLLSVIKKEILDEIGRQREPTDLDSILKLAQQLFASRVAPLIS